MTVRGDLDALACDAGAKVIGDDQGALARAVADAPWDDALLADVAAVRCEDFEIVEDSRRDIDASLDLLAIAVRP